MGARPWKYFVPYQPDVLAALEALRTREFEAGRYCMDDDADDEVPQTPPRSIQEVIERAGPSGTRSILDMVDGISLTPRNFCVSPLGRELLIAIFGNAEPTREEVEKGLHPRTYIERGIWLPDQVRRGQGVYIVVYAGGRPTELFFFGYSVD